MVPNQMVFSTDYPIKYAYGFIALLRQFLLLLLALLWYYHQFLWTDVKHLSIVYMVNSLIEVNHMTVAMTAKGPAEMFFSQLLSMKTVSYIS